MNTLILLMSIICFIFSAYYWIFVKLNEFNAWVMSKTTSLLGVILPVIYWLKLLNII
jgi:hypothetical protein